MGQLAEDRPTLVPAAPLARYNPDTAGAPPNTNITVDGRYAPRAGWGVPGLRSFALCGTIQHEKGTLPPARSQRPRTMVLPTPCRSSARPICL